MDMGGGFRRMLPRIFFGGELNKNTDKEEEEEEDTEVEYEIYGMYDFRYTKSYHIILCYKVNYIIFNIS